MTRVFKSVRRLSLLLSCAAAVGVFASAAPASASDFLGSHNGCSNNNGCNNGCDSRCAKYYSEPSYNLFYNYSVGPGRCGVYGAQLYPCPYPTPAVTGHTYYTYPPFYPHHYMRKHIRVFPGTIVTYH